MYLTRNEAIWHHEGCCSTSNSQVLDVVSHKHTDTIVHLSEKICLIWLNQNANTTPRCHCSVLLKCFISFLVVRFWERVIVFRQMPDVCPVPRRSRTHCLHTSCADIEVIKAACVFMFHTHTQKKTSSTTYLVVVCRFRSSHHFLNYP